MTTLSRRATPAQQRVLKIVAGAVKQTLDHHPDWRTEDSARLATSIAKRATGTLTAAMPDAFAVSDDGKTANVHE